MEVAFLLLLMPWLAHSLMGASRDINLHIIRQNTGDLFTPEGIRRTGCSAETCVGLSSGTAASSPGGDHCNCQCHPHLPAFREDLSICVDDIHECVLSPFVGGVTSQTIPFVFLPLKGQIIHPSKEISFAGIQTPVCAVSGAKFLTETGWIDLRNPIDLDVPFRLFRDEGRTFLQWIGESDLRNKMSGRLVLVYLMCREIATDEPLQAKANTIFSPCVAFRVVGSPSKYLNNVTEIAFDAQAASSEKDHLSLSEYIAIGICSVLLGLIYVASVFLYLHLRKRNRAPSHKTDDTNLSNAEEGIVKNNPLLGMPQFQSQDSESNDSEPDMSQDVQEDRIIPTQMTSALIHSQYMRRGFSNIESMQDSASNEKLPEENVSIVETLEGREERPDNLNALTGTMRKKLYFNPAFFELQLLIAPPPAALEFLSKIREVITIAKQKMALKKFSPSLLGIPEEENHYALDPLHDYPSTGSRRNSIVSLKRENSRRKSCTGCPGCEPDFRRLSEFHSLMACNNCSSSDSKQRSIQKWLEDVPILKADSSPKRVRSPTRSLPPIGISSPVRALSPRPSSEKASPPATRPPVPERNTLRKPPVIPNKTKPKSVRRPKADRPPSPASDAGKPTKKISLPPSPASDRARSPASSRGRSPSGSDIYKPPRKLVVKPKSPPPPRPEHHYDTVSQEIKKFPPPDLVVNQEEKVPTLKKNMNAVIHQLTEMVSEPELRNRVDYESDSLERSGRKGNCTPSEYAEVPSSHPSPSLSSALPMEEELTMQNAILNKNTGNMTISKINMENSDDDHDYELIVLKKCSLKKQGFYKLPELLQRSNGYSLVSEVYVNNGYNYGSAPSSDGGSNNSTLENGSLKVREEEPGKLLIEVEDCADHYIPVDEENFEPDTLDRKPQKLKLLGHDESEFVDSLERPRHILLKSKGSFKKDESTDFNHVFGSLREIYEAKSRGQLKDTFTNICDSEGKLLTLEERHCKRQRRLTVSNCDIIPPDVIPPPPHNNSPIYEKPKPPRKVLQENLIQKPPLPPKNGHSRSAVTETSNGTPEKDACILRSSLPQTIQLFQAKKCDDLGYLSTDSKGCSPDKGSESEESLEDGHSESGAESIETHSVFFNCFRKPNYLAFGSLDSGVDADNSGMVAEDLSSDSENVSYTTVVPLTTFNTIVRSSQI